MIETAGVSRRSFLVTIAGMTVSMANSESSSAELADVELGWIDAHSHIWTPDTENFPLQPGLTKEDLAPPSFTDDELMAVAGPEGVTRAVLIQHTRYHGFDNSYLVDAARRHPQRFRVVGMVDSRKPGAGRAMRGLLEKRVTGFRITPSRLGKDWLRTDGMQEMWKTGAATGQAMCCLVNPDDLGEVDAMCERHAQTPVVIDHFARVGVSGEIRENELASLCRLARHKRVHVKLSAYYALGRKTPPYDDLIPMIRRVLDAFGPERCMWASDCPYQLQGKNTYAASVSLIRDRIDFLSDSDRDQILRKTAAAVYFSD